MKKSFVLMVAGLVFLLFATPTHAVSIGFDPVSQTVALGSSVNVDIIISDLGEFEAPSLGAFDLDVAFDPSVLSFTGLTFGNQLDVLGLGSMRDFTIGTGTINLFEISFDWPEDLNALQSGSFVLASLTFGAVGVGTSPLSLSLNALGDAYGDALSVDPLIESAVTVTGTTPVPEPASLFLMLTGLAGIGIGAVKRRFGGTR